MLEIDLKFVIENFKKKKKLKVKFIFTHVSQAIKTYFHSSSKVYSIWNILVILLLHQKNTNEMELKSGLFIEILLPRAKY